MADQYHRYDPNDPDPERPRPRIARCYVCGNFAKYCTCRAVAPKPRSALEALLQSELSRPIQVTEKTLYEAFSVRTRLPLPPWMLN